MASFLLIDVYRITGLGIVVVGEVKSGVLRPGMRTNVRGKPMEIRSMEMKHRQLSEANEGEHVGIFLKGGDYDLLNKSRNSEIDFF